jgi:DNA gyrase/topoisomerase IV subunit B
VSFVNSINTVKGGTHANYVADAVAACVPRAQRSQPCSHIHTRAIR